MSKPTWCNAFGCSATSAFFVFYCHRGVDVTVPLQNNAPLSDSRACQLHESDSHCFPLLGRQTSNDDCRNSKNLASHCI